MYTFNHNFETVFNLEKTMAKVKRVAIDEILSTNAFDDSECFKSLATQYKSSRTFITLKQERISKIKDKRSRNKIADMLKLPLDENGNFSITTPEEASLLLRYLCFKIFQDNETKDVLEANSVTKLSIT
jgi:vacuolar-type H+-ATPase catalytic subunit A/Vma1